MIASGIKSEIKRLDRKELARMLSELADFKPENEVWLKTRLYGPKLESSLEFYKKRIRNAFFGKDAPSLKLARTALNDYKKVSGDLESNIDLMVSYVENGTELTLKYGDMWGAFYTSLENVYIDLLKTLAKPKNRHLIDKFKPRLIALVDKTEDIGWGCDILQRLKVVGFPCICRVCSQFFESVCIPC